MKKLIRKSIDFFAYKHPELWHEIFDVVFLYTDECETKSRERMRKRIEKLVKKYKI